MTGLEDEVAVYGEYLAPSLATAHFRAGNPTALTLHAGTIMDRAGYPLVNTQVATAVDPSGATDSTGMSGEVVWGDGTTTNLDSSNFTYDSNLSDCSYLGIAPSAGSCFIIDAQHTVSTRKSCERARRNSAWRSLAATPVAVLLVRGFAVRRWLGPGAEVLGAGVPGQGPGECLAGQGLSAVAAAFVEVGGQVGNGIQSGQLGSREDGPDVGGGPGGARVLGAARVLPGP